MPVKRKSKKENEGSIAKELDAIKRLLILQLITSGVQATDIASALGVHKSSVSRLVSKRKVKLP